ncbi:MAG: hypothetical protein K1X94_19695 [Sandaracinaceae bacterium]|nr:hypothetical protein [Sandaracinaceae bacterium]
MDGFLSLGGHVDITPNAHHTVASLLPMAIAPRNDATRRNSAEIMTRRIAP